MRNGEHYITKKVKTLNQS